MSATENQINEAFDRIKKAILSMYLDGQIYDDAEYFVLESNDKIQFINGEKKYCIKMQKRRYAKIFK